MAKLSKNDKELFQILHNERAEDARVFNKKNNKGFWSSVVYKYKEKAHFVYELLQNADDAQATEATFSLRHEDLVFRHNGKVRFSISSTEEENGHINAITSIGNSNKENNGNTIGKFGVGFKAVFQYTKLPHIYDDNFCFKIENYIVPTLVSTDFEGRKKGETVFVFPFDTPVAAFKEISKRLGTLNNPILFLRNLQKVTIFIEGEETKEYSKETLEQHRHKDILHEFVSLNNFGNRNQIHLFTEKITVTEDGKESSHYISAAYPLNENGELDTSKDRNVFCFFPTAENFEIKCHVHAPFLLVDSRQQLKVEEDYNDQLIELLAKLAAKALVYLRDFGIDHKKTLINENIFDFFPKSGKTYNTPSGKFYRAYLNVISENDLLLTQKKKYISVEEARICRPISMLQILTDTQLTCLLNESNRGRGQYAFLHKNIQNKFEQNYVEYILNWLGVEVFDGAKLAKSITPRFMEENGMKWAKRLYNHLQKEQVRLFKYDKSVPAFGQSPIIYTTDEEWCSAYNTNGLLQIYLPQKGKAKDFHFASLEYKDDQECMNFLQGLGLKQPDDWDYIKTHILPNYKSEWICQNITQENANDDFEKIFIFINSIKDNSEKESRLQEIRENYRLINIKRAWKKVTELYQYNDFLVSYFANDGSYFVDEKSYQTFIDEYSHRDFIDFLDMLGVSQNPNVKKETRQYYEYFDRKRFSLDGRIGQNTKCDITDWSLDGFDDWEPESLDQSKRIWCILVEALSDIEKRTATAKWQYYKTPYYEDCDSSLLVSVKENEWIITSDGKCHSISDVTFADLAEAEYDLNHEFLRLLGIEKKSKSLQELGASENQIETFELGECAEKYGIDNVEKLKKIIEKGLEKENEERAREIKEEQKEETISEKRKELSETSFEEQSATTKEYLDKPEKTPKTTEEKVSDIVQKMEDEARTRIKTEKLRESVCHLDKYTKKWFDSLLELEYQSSATGNDYNRNRVKINFHKITKEGGDSLIYVLGSPSRDIPLWIEEIGDISVKFSFSNKDDQSFLFDVANVKDFTLRLKAKLGDAAALKKIDLESITKATVEINSPVEIMNRLKQAFKGLDFEDTFNFRDNLQDNISFVFGPPGTGKTTRLSEIINKKMEKKDCRILVLAPTNKACDVLTRKILDTNPASAFWLGRFVATGDTYIESSGTLIDRDSDLHKKKKCCIVSTIARLPYDGFTGSQLLKEIKWDYVIIDEASMIPLVQIVFALYQMPDANFIIAGDPLQIAPIVQQDEWKDENIYTMVELNDFKKATTVPRQFHVEKLNRQYRSIPSIGSLYSRYSYNGMLEHDREERDCKKSSLQTSRSSPLLSYLSG